MHVLSRLRVQIQDAYGCRCDKRRNGVGVQVRRTIRRDCAFDRSRQCYLPPAIAIGWLRLIALA
jgi:hypothetical protein